MNWGNTRTFTLTGTGFNSGAQVTLDGANVTEVVEPRDHHYGYAHDRSVGGLRTPSS